MAYQQIIRRESLSKIFLKISKGKVTATQKAHWSFLPLWIMATAIGTSCGGITSAFVTDYVRGDFGVFLSFAVMSMAIALMQWLVIRRQILGMGWLLATWVGGTVGGSLSSWASFQLAITYGDAADLLAIYACLRGFSTGLAQWILLKQYFRGAGWWIAATTASAYISLMVGSLLIFQLGYFLTLLVGSIYGILTGIVLLVFFWSRRQSG